MTYDNTDADSDGVIEADVDNQSVTTDETHTETIGDGDYHYAGDYDGSNSDERLDAALSAASDNDVVCLENSSYNQDRVGSSSIDEQVLIMGTNVRSGATISADWELTANGVFVTRLELDGRADATLTLSGGFDGRVRDIQLSGNTTDVVIEGDKYIVSHITGNGEVTFASGTSGSIFGLSVVSVTDNGTNTIN